MSPSVPAKSRQLQSTVHRDGHLSITLAEIDTPTPGPGEVLVRMEAAPINPSDLGLLFGPADMTRVEAVEDGRSLRAPIPKSAMAGVAARVDQPMPVGNEGAGIVVAAGDATGEPLIGRTVSIVGGATYSQYRVAPAAMVLPMPEGTKPAEAASWFVNPLTALGMVETMKREGHTALVHTAAASNLGQMLNRICLADDIPLVNVVRREAQVALLREQGARHVCNSSDADFEARLTDALAETGATLGFDATGGGRLAGRILACMERALLRKETEYSRYGSNTHKQVYLYGRLDRSETILGADLGMAWGLGGWLLPPFLARIGPEATARLRDRVAAEIKTTFASHYTAVISLVDAVSVDTLRAYGRQATGEKYLIDPQR
jgi:NADPH:quinone reductase-like Zn-dependent oxidoreductase